MSLTTYSFRNIGVFVNGYKIQISWAETAPVHFGTRSVGLGVLFGSKAHKALEDIRKSGEKYTIRVKTLIDTTDEPWTFEDFREFCFCDVVIDFDTTCIPAVRYTFYNK